MENRLPRQNAGIKSVMGEGKGKPVIPGAPETKIVQQTITPVENDPSWAELGATRIVEKPSESSPSGTSPASTSNYTEFSPSRILGKNLVALGDFELTRKLGEGAMGAVYKARQLSFGRTVALKVLFPHIANNRKLVERLYREGLVMGQLDHPNIIQAYAIDEAEGCHYVAMEYVSGQNMQQWLTALGKLPVGDAVRIALDCAEALAYAHTFTIPELHGDDREYPMVHRDIKPENILLTKNGVVKIADFGMVKIDAEEMSLTQTGHAVGTPWYMPLEQARNAKEIDGRSDIYALGCTLYAFLTGNPPFTGRTIVDVIKAKETGTFPPARQANPDVPERLDLILAKMIAKLPKYRYQTCEDLIKDLESLNLASSTLSFMQEKPAATDSDEETNSPGKTSILSASGAKSKSDSAETVSPTPTAANPDLWYVQVKMSDGKLVTRKYTTAQLQKLMGEGTILPTTRASHSPNRGFRSLATYKQFQGAALSKMTKQVSDKSTSQYLGIYQKYAEKDRQRELDNKPSSMDPTTRYWLNIFLTVLPIGVGIAFFVVFLVWASNGFPLPW